MLCPTCDRSLPPGAQTCTGCGTALAVPLAAAPQSVSMAPAQGVPPAASQINVTVNTVAAATPVVIVANRATGPGCLLRGFYFVLVGWWLSQLWILAAWALNLTVLGLPLGLMMLNRLPQVVTLKATATRVDVAMLNGAVVIGRTQLNQQPMWLRALYFAVVGWWASLLWVETAWLLTATVIGLPLAFWMYDRTPAVTTLARR